MPGKDPIVFPSIRSTIDSMQDSVSSTGLGKIKKSTTEKTLTRLTESQPYRIVHPSGNDHLKLTTIGFGTKDVGCSSCVPLSFSELQGLLLKASLAPVKIPVRPQIRTVQIVTTSPDGTTIKPGYPLICHIVTICVSEFPDVRRRSDIDGSLMNEDALRKWYFVGKNGRMIKDSISIAVDEAQDPMAWCLELSRRLATVP